jgi:5-methylcytosine-specific restriction enzyme subunit McrC
LIYPVGDSTVDAAYEIDGFPIRIYTLNLAQDWAFIEADLLKLIDVRIPLLRSYSARNVQVI